MHPYNERPRLINNKTNGEQTKRTHDNTRDASISALSFSSHETRCKTAQRTHACSAVPCCPGPALLCSCGDITFRSQTKRRCHPLIYPEQRGEFFGHIREQLEARSSILPLLLLFASFPILSRQKAPSLCPSRTRVGPRTSTCATTTSATINSSRLSGMGPLTPKTAPNICNSRGIALHSVHRHSAAICADTLFLRTIPSLPRTPLTKTPSTVIFPNLATTTTTMTLEFLVRSDGVALPVLSVQRLGRDVRGEVSDARPELAPRAEPRAIRLERRLKRVDSSLLDANFGGRSAHKKQSMDGSGDGLNIVATASRAARHIIRRERTTEFTSLLSQCKIPTAVFIS